MLGEEGGHGQTLVWTECIKGWPPKCLQASGDVTAAAGTLVSDLEGDQIARRVFAQENIGESAAPEQRNEAIVDQSLLEVL